MTYVKTKLYREITIDSIITLHYFEYMKDFVFAGESHDFWEMLYVDKGTVNVQAGEDWFVLNSGDVIFHQPNEFHAIKSIGKNSPNLVAISFTSASPAMELFKQKICTLEMEERALISQIINEAKKTFSTPIHVPSVEQVLLREEMPFASQQLILLYLELFLIRVHRHHTENTVIPVHPPQSTEVDASKEQLFRDIQQFMEFHICERITVPDICQHFSISRSALQALFHERKGGGAIEYFNNMKIERAKDIIRDGTMNFTEIAYFLAYSSLPYFSKQFKKATGMSPQQYATSVKGMTEALRKHVDSENKTKGK